MILNCELEKGMFSDEYTVILNTVSGRFATFIDKAHIDNKAVKVKIVHDNDKTVAVLLPDECGSVVIVKKEELKKV